MTKLRIWDISGQLITIHLETEYGVTFVIYPN